MDKAHKIGLEIHGYLRMDNKTKLFCECKIDRDASPNKNICPICTGQPGSKPMLTNKEALDKIIAISLMLGCKVNGKLMFQRKHYSWPDLPNGFQKTMSGAYSWPVAVDGNFLGVGITQVHLEEDPAKWDPVSGKIDYNRSGYPLVEIVTEPDFESPEQVEEWLKNLLTTLSYIRAVEKNAGIKSDVNVSIAPKYVRTEVKNVNSITSIVQAIKYELERQQKEKENKQQTRAFDELTGKTSFMRSKETAQDYMFIPEPDLPVINVSKALLEKIESSLPEKPAEKLKRFSKVMKEEDAVVISNNIALAEIFDGINKIIKDPQFVASWLRRDVVSCAWELGKDMDELNVSSLKEWFELLHGKKISPVKAKELLPPVLEGKIENAAEFVKESGEEIISGDSELESLAREAIASKKEAVRDYKAGKEAALNAVVGYVMGKTRGKADPEKAKETIRRLLE